MIKTAMRTIHSQPTSIKLSDWENEGGDCLEEGGEGQFPKMCRSGYEWLK